MLGDRERDAVGETRDRPLERGIFEGRDLAAAVANEMVVVALVTMRLKAGGAVSDVEPSDETELGELFEGPIHARAAHGPSPPAHAVFDLANGQRAALAPEELDDRSAGAPAAMAGGGEAVERIPRPGLHVAQPTSWTVR